MKSRLNNLAENNLPQRLLRVKQDFDALKNNQALGSTSVKMYRVVTGNDSDWTVTAAYHAINCFQITFTPSGIVLPDTGFLWHAFFNTRSLTGSDTAIFAIDGPIVSGDSWIYNLYVQGGDPAHTPIYNMYAVIYAMSEGTISVVQTM
jgi:hypothetical protein